MTNRDARVAALESEDLLSHGRDLARAVVGVRSDLLPVMGGVHAGMGEFAVANSEGLARELRTTGLGASVYVVQRKRGVSTGFASRESTRSDLSWDAIGREAGELAVASSNPRKIGKPGRFPCVVRPEPASELLGTITIPSLYGKPAHRGESFYSGKLGRPVMHAKLSIVDDATVPRGLGSSPFDDEGTATRPQRPVRGGVLRSFLYDRKDGAEWDHASTGNAVRSHPFDGRSYKSPPETSALQVRLDAPKTSTAKLVASLDDGLLLHDLMGVHTANAVSGDFSVTSSVLFRIRKGALEGPAAPVSVAGNLHALLRGGIRLGDDVKVLGGDPAWSLPSVLVGGLAVTP